jgi:D-alanyl-D-alanine carboxypeptidase
MKQQKLNFILAGVILVLIPFSLEQLVPLVRFGNYPLPSLSNYPVNFTAVPAPYLTARSAVVIDADSKAILLAKNPDEKLLPASTTKIMTALVALDKFALTDVVSVGDLTVEPMIMKLKSGERITVENLLYGLLVGSANDAAIALARFYPGGQAEFVKAMNQKARELHLESTQFTNPIGLDNVGHYTTSHDLSLLAAVAMQNPEFAKLVSTQAITVSDADNTVSHELTNVNQLLGKIPGLAGVKTGWTINAGECLVSYTVRNHRKIITVVLDSADRFGETAILIDWVWANHRWEEFPANR